MRISWKKNFSEFKKKCIRSVFIKRRLTAVSVLQLRLVKCVNYGHLTERAWKTVLRKCAKKKQIHSWFQLSSKFHKVRNLGTWFLQFLSPHPRLTNPTTTTTPTTQHHHNPHHHLSATLGTDLWKLDWTHLNPCCSAGARRASHYTMVELSSVQHQRVPFSLSPVTLISH